ncbi:transcription repressor OFP8-like [Typha latifolia]|uniref:transcription repressor OFP8-like n=1 Tax=Typha latifolia TaxID=4733 RepID=UPI003C309590
MSSSRNRSFILRNPVVVDIGCNCRRTKLFSLFSSSSSSSSSSHSKSKSTTLSSSTTTPTATAYNSSSWEASFTTNSLYEEYSSPPPPPPSAVLNEGRLRTNRDQRRKKKKKKNANGGRVARESVAVAVESNEPYEDFRDSMVQMIVEKDIYAWDDLNDLLHEFLSLNSPRHHPLIIHAFADLWNGLFSPPSPCL